jgi:hypothetical protein
LVERQKWKKKMHKRFTNNVYFHVSFNSHLNSLFSNEVGHTDRKYDDVSASFCYWNIYNLFFFCRLMCAWYVGVCLVRNRCAMPLVSLQEGIHIEKFWSCNKKKTPSHACMYAMGNSARNLFFTLTKAYSSMAPLLSTMNPKSA